MLGTLAASPAEASTSKNPEEQARWILSMAESTRKAGIQPVETLAGGLDISQQAAEAIDQNYCFDHCGLLLACVDSDRLLHLLNKEGYRVAQRFPSKILQGVLSADYNKPVSIDIVKLEGESTKLELFLVNDGLTEEELGEACVDHSHVALSPKTTETVPQPFFDIMVEAGMKLENSGINKQEAAKSADGRSVRGVTVMYFGSEQSWLGGLEKLELCTPGQNSDLIEQAKEKTANA